MAKNTRTDDLHVLSTQNPRLTPWLWSILDRLLPNYQKETDAETVRLGRLLVGFCTGLFLCCLVFCLVTWSVGKRELTGFELTALLLFYPFVLVFFRVTRSTFLSSMLFVWGSLLLFAFEWWGSGQGKVLVLFWNALIPLFAVCLLGVRWGGVSALFVVFGYTMLLTSAKGGTAGHLASIPVDVMLLCAASLFVCLCLSIAVVYETSRRLSVVSVDQALDTLHQEHAELQSERGELERLVAERTMDATRSRDQALEANQIKNLFLTNMSHELRTPLNAIIGYTELLQEDILQFTPRECLADLRKIYRASQHLLEMVNDVLDLSRIEAGKIKLYLEWCEVKEFVENIALTIKPLTKKNGNHFEWDVDESLDSMRTDLRKLRQSVLNLLSNACKFTQEGTVVLQVYPTTLEERDFVAFEVRDTGIGIPPEKLDGIFQFFVQGDISATKRYGGTGLGLTISQKLCHLMGGQIEVESAEGEGSTFTLLVPVIIEGAVQRNVLSLDNLPAAIPLKTSGS